MSGPPVPADPAVQSTQSFTITELNPGLQYYVGIITYDDAGLNSGISNIPRGFTRGITAPVTDSIAVNSVDSLVTLYAGQVESYLTVDYQFVLDTDIGFSNPVYGSGTKSGSDVFAAYDNLLENIYYYWRCRAIANDLSDTSSWSSISDFMVVNFATEETVEPQGGFIPISPLSSALLDISHPTLVVSNLNDNPNTYRFEISLDSSYWGDLTAASPDIEQGLDGRTVWRVEDRLSSGRYYWRAQVNGTIYSSIAYFEIMPRSHVFPNPFRPYETSFVTFAEIPANHKVTITTVSGAVVTTLSGNAAGDDIIWEGTNESNNQVSSGVYLWYVEGTELNGKLIIIR